MFWVVQNDLYRERGYDHLLETLVRFGLPHAVVQLAPIVHRVLPGDFDSAAWPGDVDDAPEAVIDTRGPVMVCGSVTLSKIAQERGWTPGTYLNANNDYAVWSRAYGVDCLNAGAVVSRFDAVPRRKEFFIRPTLDDKSFTGKVMNWGAYERWRDEVFVKIAAGDDLTPVRPETLVATAAPRPIHAEFRFFVVDGRVVTASQYKRNGRSFQQAGADPTAAAFAVRMIARWQPARAFVLDVALTSDGPKVVEIGCINSAGFYEADVSALIQALEAMDGP